MSSASTITSGTTSTTESGLSTTFSTFGTSLSSSSSSSFSSTVTSSTSSTSSTLTSMTTSISSSSSSSISSPTVTTTSTSTTAPITTIPSSTSSSSSSIDSTTELTTTSTFSTTGSVQSTSTSTSTSTSVSTSTSDSSSDSSSSSASSSATPVSTIIPYAITYSPYNDDGSCKTSSEVASDFELIVSKQIMTVRIYGTDCDSISTVEGQLDDYGLTVVQGLWIDDTGVDSIDTGLDDLITWGSENSNWDLVEMIIIGNEAVSNGYCTADELLTKITSVRTQLQDAGYTGPITTAESPDIFINNASLCQSDSLDLVGINSHPYFDASSSAESAGTFNENQIALTKAACNDKEVFITESGYPSAGIVNGGNVPSVANQKIAIEKILEASQGNLIIFTVYNDLWKSLGPYGVEQSFGIIDLLE
ncbi:glycoside hydrolase superfamily [Lipomyces oligophaga]|uniref:glycoside hydrolase superfamily n=1 Tax=Lipomyces oligophaga TaxID=45792 RepID=UPI0034CDBE68